MARRRGGIKIVWLAWFIDSVALWQRQDEIPYLLDPSPLSQGSGPHTNITQVDIGADGGLRDGERELDPDDEDSLYPRAKRKRLLSERSLSKLNHVLSAEELAQDDAETASNGSAPTCGTPAEVAPATETQDIEQDEDDEGEDDDDDDDSTDSDDSSEEEEDDDFLTRALEEDMR